MKRFVAFILSFAFIGSCSAFARQENHVSFPKINEYQSNQYTDVSDSNVFAANVQLAYECGIMTGQTKHNLEYKMTCHILQH